MDKTIKMLEADVRALEEAADAAVAERTLLRKDLDTATAAILQLARMHGSLSSDVDALETDIISLQGEAYERDANQATKA